MVLILQHHMASIYDFITTIKCIHIHSYFSNKRSRSFIYYSTPAFPSHRQQTTMNIKRSATNHPRHRGVPFARAAAILSLLLAVGVSAQGAQDDAAVAAAAAADTTTQRRRVSSGRPCLPPMANLVRSKQQRRHWQMPKSRLPSLVPCPPCPSNYPRLR